MNGDRSLTPDELDRLARYLAGSMDPAEQRSFEHAILEDPALADALYSQASLSARMPAAAPAPRVMPMPVRTRAAWRWAVAVPAAAALIAAVVLTVPARLGRHAPTEILRGDEAVPRLLTPTGALERKPTRFTWTTAAGAVTYRLEVVDADAKPVFQTSTSDTSIELPQDALPATLTAARWRVVPLDESGLELPIPSWIEFTVVSH